MRRGTPWGYALILSLPTFILLSVFVCVDGGVELLEHIPEDGICKSMDIRNGIESFKQLDGCQVIEGSLQILLFDTVNETELSQLTFPKLVEITDYLLLFRVNGLKSVGQLFPNLAVIRGQHLFPGRKALVIFEMDSLQEIGLYSLTKIMNGSVFVDKNPSLCFVHSIDWSKIIQTDDSSEEDGISYTSFLKSFKPENECPVCPPEINGKPCPRNEKDNNKFLCWNRNHCQKICACDKRACNDNGECCDVRCEGGCGRDITRCKACRELVLSTDNKSSNCVQKCPSQFLAYLNRRCVTSTECINMTRPIDFEESDSDTDMIIDQPYKIHEGSCILQCPPNYSSNYKDHTCVRCNNTCRKDCPGARIDSINLARQLRGCTHITGSVEIQIRGGNQVVKALQENLEMIEEIDGYLKVVRSFSLISLNFLKNLKRIRGKILDSQRYSLIVLDNQNLQDLFNWKTHKTFKIDNGRLFFHFNPKLCIDKIDELRKKAYLPPYTELEVASNSNGDKVACTVSKLDVHIGNIASDSASLEWKPFDMDDPRNLLSYLVYSIEAPTQNVNFFDGRDACGQDNWHVDDVANNIHNKGTIRHNLYYLKPFTQYAVYVKTYTIATEKRGAQSDILYFKTRPSLPSEPASIRVISYSSDTLNISWSPPIFPNGIISHYLVTGTKQKHQIPSNRNYCLDSVVPETPKKVTTVPPKTKTQDCKSSKDRLDSKLINEQEEVARIDFENALHNKVYIRKTVNQRSPRNVDEIIDRNTINGSLSSFKIRTSDFDNSALPPYISNSTELGGKSFTFLVNVSLLSLQVQNLHHFTVYNVAVRACMEQENEKQELACGDPMDTTAVTLEKKGADNIYNVSVLNTTSDSVTVRWSQPPDPNRMIVSVTIWYRREGTKYSQYIGECISFNDFKNYSRGNYMVYTIPKLFPGNHSFYLRASSLFGLGDPSKILSFQIPESGPNTVLITLLVFLFIFLAILAGVWLFYRKTIRERDLMRLIPAVNPDYMPSVYVVDEWEVPRKNVELIKELGQGSFGMVWEGIGHDFKDIKGVFRCAVKTVNENATRRERIDFLNEASVMKAFNTAHVVKLLGVVSQGQPALVVMELMVNGDLKSYLRSHRPENNDGKPPPTLKQILHMAVEIADGMAYLEGKKFVHRDLAARNCMVAEDLTVKIGDFGMTRDIYETDYYRKGSRGLLPVRWMSPESLKDGVFSSSSDCWSYGVVLWEMATLASQPYQGLSNEQVLRYIMDGGMMERPENCPDKLYNVMKLCWDLKPGRRPSFMKLCEILLPDANEKFFKVSFYHSAEGTEARTIRANATAEVTVGDAGDGDDADASTPLNALPPDVRIVGTYTMSTSERSDSIQSVHMDPNPRFYSVSEDRTANGFAGGRVKNGKAQSQC